MWLVGESTIPLLISHWFEPRARAHHKSQFSITGGQGWWYRAMLCTVNYMKKEIFVGGVFDSSFDQPQLFGN